MSGVYGPRISPTTAIAGLPLVITSESSHQMAAGPTMTGEPPLQGTQHSLPLQKAQPSTAFIVAVVMGVLLFLLVTVAGVWLWRRRAKRNVGRRTQLLLGKFPYRHVLLGKEGRGAL